uniref:Uncharacterized protein n=1 Tax=Anguilla anguilla TaxID=7936 RepID=A0A0E9PQ50_ANGAN
MSLEPELLLCDLFLLQMGFSLPVWAQPSFKECIKKIILSGLCAIIFISKLNFEYTNKKARNLPV